MIDLTSTLTLDIYSFQTDDARVVTHVPHYVSQCALKNLGFYWSVYLNSFGCMNSNSCIKSVPSFSDAMAGEGKHVPHYV